jgi:hypothetical protein
MGNLLELQFNASATAIVQPGDYQFDRAHFNVPKSNSKNMCNPVDVYWPRIVVDVFRRLAIAAPEVRRSLTYLMQCGDA